MYPLCQPVESNFAARRRAAATRLENLPFVRPRKFYKGEAMKKKLKPRGRKGGRKPAKRGEKRISASINLKPRHWRALDQLAKPFENSRSRWVESKIVESSEVPIIGKDGGGNFQSLENQKSEKTEG